MASKRISELPDGGTLQDTDLIPAARGAGNVRVSGAEFKAQFDAAGVAASRIATHEADTTAVHGIADTAQLETKSGAQAKADAAAAAAAAGEATARTSADSLKVDKTSIDTDSTFPAASSTRVPSTAAVKSAIASAGSAAVNTDEVFASGGPKTISGTSEVILPVLVAPFPMRITGAALICASSLALSTTDYWVMTPRRMRASTPVTPYSDVVLGDAPYAYWRLDEAVAAPNALDLGSGNHPLAYSTPAPTLGTAALVRKCSDTAAAFVRASATSAASAADYAWDMSGNAVTIEAFIKTNILALGSNERQAIFYRPTVGVQPSLELGGQSSQGRLAMVTQGAFRCETESFVILPGNVYHVVYRRSAWDGTSATEDFFVNGAKQVNVNTFSQVAFTAATTGTYIGRRPGGAGTPANQYFDGVIDDVAVYNYALTDAQIQNHADYGAAISDLGRKHTKNVTPSGEAITAYQPWNFDAINFDSYAQTLQQGDSLVMSFFPFGTPAALTDCFVQVTYEAL